MQAQRVQQHAQTLRSAPFSPMSPISLAWDLKLGTPLTAIDVTAEGRYIVGGHADGTVSFLRSDACVLWSRAVSPHEVSAVAITNAGYIAVCTSACETPGKAASTCTILHRDGVPIQAVDLPHQVTGAVFSPTGRHLLLAAEDGSVFLFERNHDGYELKRTAAIVDAPLAVKAIEEGFLLISATSIDAIDTSLASRWTQPMPIPSRVVAAGDTAEHICALAEEETLMVLNLSASSQQMIRLEHLSEPRLAASGTAIVLALSSPEDGLTILDSEGHVVWADASHVLNVVACSTDGAHVLGTSDRGTLRRYDNMATERVIAKVVQLESEVLDEMASKPSFDRRLRSELEEVCLEHGLAAYGAQRLLAVAARAPSNRNEIHAFVERVLRKHLDRHPTDGLAHYAFARYCQAVDRLPDAVAHLQRAALHPSLSSKALREATTLLGSLGLTRAEAVTARRARRSFLDRGNIHIIYRLARAYDAEGRTSEAASHYEAVLAVDLHYLDAWRRLLDIKAREQSTLTIPRDEAARSVSMSAERRMQRLIRDRQYFSARTNTRGIAYHQHTLAAYDQAPAADEVVKLLEAICLLEEIELRSLAPRASLDIGSASGRYPSLLSRLGWRSVGIDRSPAAVAYARSHAGGGDSWPQYVLGDARSLPFDDEQFDLVTCMMGTFAHIPRDEQPIVLREMSRVLRPHGMMAISTWDLDCPHLDFLALYDSAQKRQLLANCRSQRDLADLLTTCVAPDVRVQPFGLLPKDSVFALGWEALGENDLALAIRAEMTARETSQRPRGEMYLATACKPASC